MICHPFGWLLKFGNFPREKITHRQDLRGLLKGVKNMNIILDLHMKVQLHFISHILNQIITLTFDASSNPPYTSLSFKLLLFHEFLTGKWGLELVYQLHFLSTSMKPS